MNRHFLNRVITLVAMLGLAVASLLLLFLLLGRNAVGATSAGVGPILDVRAQGDTFAVSGTVTCEATIWPISGVEVFAWNRKGHDHVITTTDSSGYYSVTLQESNYYDLTFNPPCGKGCASKAYKGITGPPDQTRNVTLTSGYSVSGTVFATDSITSVGNVAIYVFNHDTADGFGLPCTDNNGHYCVNLAEGYDDLSFTPPACLGLGPKAGIIVTQTMTRNVTLPPGFTVAGRVTDGASNSISGVQIYARECYTWTGYGFSPSNADGYYTGTLPIGTFGIQFLPLASRGLGPQTFTDVVSTTAGCPNRGLNVTLPEGFTVSGQVTCQGEPVKNVFVYTDPAGPPPDCYGLDGVGVYTVDDGSYGLPLVPGTYDIQFIPPPATGFNEVITTDFQILTDTILNVNLCPLFLPMIFKSYAPAW